MRPLSKILLVLARRPGVLCAAARPLSYLWWSGASVEGPVGVGVIDGAVYPSDRTGGGP